jgi:hypothetical protein
MKIERHVIVWTEPSVQNGPHESLRKLVWLVQLAVLLTPVLLANVIVCDDYEEICSSQ